MPRLRSSVSTCSRNFALWATVGTDAQAPAILMTGQVHTGRDEEGPIGDLARHDHSRGIELGVSGYGRAMTSATTRPHLRRRISLRQAIALNMGQMCGVGPFITI